MHPSSDPHGKSRGGELIGGCAASARGELLAPPTPQPRIRLDGRDMPAFHPILTTDYFEYGSTVNRLDRIGAAVEMGDAALGRPARSSPIPRTG